LIYERFASLIGAGVPLSNALELTGIKSDPNYHILEFAISVGAPLGATLAALSAHQQNLSAFLREIESAQAVPRATRKLMLWLPLLGAAMGQLLGLEMFSALGTNLGLVSFMLGLALLYTGHSITAKMLNRSQAQDELPGHGWFRLGILLSAGESLGAAVSRSGLSAVANSSIELATKTGARLSALIEAQQREEIAQFASNKIYEAKQLAVSLLVPLGLTTLPAFLLFTVVPMLIGINQQ
jgi:tight adherence protein B